MGGVPFPQSGLSRPFLTLTSEAKMEPPIQGLNLRSMVLLLAMSFSRMLWGERRAARSRQLGSGKEEDWGWERFGSHGGRVFYGGQNTRHLGRRKNLFPKD